MKYIVTLSILIFAFVNTNAQTLHTIMMCNMNDKTLAIGNQGEVKEMKALIPMIANALGFRNNLIIHSGNEFTYNILEQEFSHLNVVEGDIVIYYYASHGVNWSDNEWPHMAFNDRQYSENSVYQNLMKAFPQAKLILCIAACCNMDAEGQARQRRSYGSMDPKLVKKLFTGFEGHRAYIASSSIRGQYSWVWTGGNRPGHMFGIALRDAIRQACEGGISPLWDYVFEAAKSKTLIYSDQKQMPQFQKNRW